MGDTEIKQKFLINTVDGEKEIIADRYYVLDGEYVFLNGNEVVDRIKIADVVETVNEDGETESGIKTIYSRSVM